MVNLNDTPIGVTFYSSDLLRFTGLINPEGVSVRGDIPVEIVELQNNVEHVVGTGGTQSDGSYNITGRFGYTGNILVFARCGDDVSGQWSVDVIDDRETTSITLSSSSNTMVKSSGSVTLSGVLSAGSGFSVKIYDENDTLIDTVTTGTNGDFSKTISNSSTVGVKNYYAVFEGDASYYDCTSSTVQVYTITDTYVGLTVTGQRIQQIHSGNLLINSNNENIVIDYGDNTLKVYDGSYTHDYSSSGTYNVKIYNVTGFGSQCFANLDDSSLGGNLTAVTLPEGITTIGNYCFKNTNLTSLIVPSSVTSIGSYAFQSGFTEITLPWAVASNIVQYRSIWNYTGWASGFKFLIPAGTTSLYTAKNYPSGLLKEDVDFDGITLTSDKNILSAYDQESATLTAQLTYEDLPVAASGETVSFEVRKTSDDSLVETLTADTNSSGVATVSYLGKASGDLYIKAIVDIVISSETYEVQDCKDYISGETDQSPKFGSSITLRTGSSTLSYDSTNKHYILTVRTTGESFLPIQSCTGLDDFTLEFDAQVNYNSSYGVGSVIYSASNNWGAIGVHQQNFNYGKTVNGTYTGSSETVSITGNTWLHFKITVTDDKVKLEILNGTTLIASHTETYDSSWFNNSTKYGLDHMWFRGRATPFKNIKVKPL